MSPLFDYECPSCKASLEKLEPYHAEPPICLSCLEATMERKPSVGTRFNFSPKVGEWEHA